MILAYAPDLMDRSKIAAAGDVEFVKAAADLVGREADLVLVDLSRPDTLEAVGAISSPRIVGFASHVDRGAMDAARAAGCTEVLARSAFFTRLSAMMGHGLP